MLFSKGIIIDDINKYLGTNGEVYDFINQKTKKICTISTTKYNKKYYIITVIDFINQDNNFMFHKKFTKKPGGIG